MTQTIGQRELRNDNAEIMRRVAAGERFVVTRNGRPVADLIPHQRPRPTRATLADIQERFRDLPAVDAERLRAEDAELFGADDPLAE